MNKLIALITTLVFSNIAFAGGIDRPFVPFNVSGNIDCSGSGGGAGLKMDIPKNKNLIIETVSVQIIGDIADTDIPAVSFISNIVPSVESGQQYSIVMNRVNAADGIGFVGTENMRVYQFGGGHRAIGINYSLESSPHRCRLTANVSGRVIDKPRGS